MISARAASRTEPAEPATSARATCLARVALVLLPSLSTAFAGDVDVVKAVADCSDRTCRFDVTLAHADTGWDHYADQWRVLDPDGNVLGVRTLAHPHVDEQPFTRSLGGVEIPEGVSHVIIDARDSVHGVSEQTIELKLDLP